MKAGSMVSWWAVGTSAALTVILTLAVIAGFSPQSQAASFRPALASGAAAVPSPGISAPPNVVVGKTMAMWTCR